MFASEVKKMSAENMKPQEQLTLEPYERDHAVVVGVYRYPDHLRCSLMSYNKVLQVVVCIEVRVKGDCGAVGIAIIY